MAKKKKPEGYTAVYPDIKEIFDELIRTKGLDCYNECTIDVTAKDDQKKIFTITKSNDYWLHKTTIGITVIINQRIFNGLPLPQQFMLVDEILAGIHCDHNKERLAITRADVSTHSGVLTQYGYDEAKKDGLCSYQALHESIKSLYDKAKEEDAESEA